MQQCRNSHFWLTILLYGVVTSLFAADARPDLAGSVRDTNGTALTNASVFIFTAGPRKGAGIMCPSCYADCRKSAATGPEGKFEIAALDPNLIFEVLILAPGHLPTFINKVDPAQGPLEARIKPRATTNLPPSQVVFGRVVNAANEPVARAVVSIHGTRVGNTTSSRPPKGLDPLAVTDDQGEFALYSTVKFDALELSLQASGYARANATEVRGGPDRRVFKMTTGATVTGRVLWQGRPLTNITMGIVGTDRGEGRFTGESVIATQPDGKFLFVNLPPNREYALYGRMETLQPYGVIPLQTIKVKGDDSLTKVGDIKVIPGHRLAGRVELSDGKPLPKNTHLMLDRPEGWDNLVVELAADGRFEFTNVPAESVTVDSRVPHYRLSARNASLSRLNPFELVGKITGDKTNLLVLLEPGSDLPSDYSSGEVNLENLPLTGAEGKLADPNLITITGKVTDAQTGKPLSKFRVTPGWSMDEEAGNWVEWRHHRAVDGADGQFQLQVSLQTGVALVLVEAEGYLPVKSGPLNRQHAACSLQLQPGTGPRGLVQMPDGSPATNVAVCYLVAGERAVLLASGGFGGPPEGLRSISRTSSTGEFSFAPKIGDGELFAAAPAGFASCQTAKLAGGAARLVLQPWARIHGRLLKDGKPALREPLNLFPAAQVQSALIPEGTVTDDEGGFAFERVPPGDLVISTRARAAQPGAWTMQPQKKFTVQPGQELDLGTIAQQLPSKAAR